MFKKGFVTYGKYGGEGQIGGKEVKKFSLSYKENGEKKYLNNVTAWMDGLADDEWDIIEDGRYIGIEYSERQNEKDGKVYTNNTVQAVWLRADGYTGAGSSSSKPVPQKQPDLYDDDLPF